LRFVVARSSNGALQGSIVWHLLFTIYINDYSATVNTLSEPKIITDNTRRGFKNISRL
jgi:hypothetical protein